MKRFSKALSFVMVLALVLTMFTGFAFATDELVDMDNVMIENDDIEEEENEGEDEFRSGPAMTVDRCCIKPLYDIEVSKTADITEAVVGDEVVYTITVTNTGIRTIYRLNVDDSIIGYHEEKKFNSGLKPDKSYTFVADPVVMTEEGEFENTVTVKAYTRLWNLLKCRYDYYKKATENASCTVNVSVPQPEYNNLTIIIEGQGEVSTSPSAIDEDEYISGTAVELTAIPDSGWYFAGWSGDLTGTNSTDTVNMNIDRAVTATFIEVEEEPEYNFLTINTVGNGTVTASPSSVEGEYLSGTAVELTAVPASGWKFDGWSGDLTGTNLTDTVTMYMDRAVTAAFIEIQEEPDPDLGLSLTKIASPSSVYLGDEVEFIITVTNTGDVDLESVYLEDSNEGYMDSFSIASGASLEFSYFKIMNEIGEYVNVATASAFYGENEIEVTASAVETVTVMNPLVVTKSAVHYAEPYDEVLFTIEVGNRGSYTLNEIGVSDIDSLGDTYFIVTVPALEAGDTTICAITVTMPGVDGQYVNTASAIGWYYDYNSIPRASRVDYEYEYGYKKYVEAADDWLVHVIDEDEPYYGIDVIKDVDDTSVYKGDTVEFTILVKNIGNRTLENIHFIDEKLNMDTVIETLAPNEEYRTTASITMDSVGTYVNIATATAIIYQGELIVEDSDTATVEVTKKSSRRDRDDDDDDDVVVVPEPEIPYTPPEVPEQDIDTGEDVVVLDTPIPYGAPVLPKTGGLGMEMLYGLSALSAGLGLVLKRKNNK